MQAVRTGHDPMTDLTGIDYGALALALVCWLGFDMLANHPRDGKWASLSHLMDRYRNGWMRVMTQRDMRMVDTIIQSAVLQGCTFFASTAILLVGGLLALLGAADQAIGIVRDLPFAAETTRALWQIKVLGIVTVLMYAFFKFAWAYRVYTYCIVVIGSAPAQEAPESADAATLAGGLIGLGARHFDRGIRAYYYALAATAWFLHPALFMVSTLWVTAVLIRREFRSKARAILARGVD